MVPNSPKISQKFSLIKGKNKTKPFNSKNDLNLKEQNYSEDQNLSADNEIGPPTNPPKIIENMERKLEK